MIILKIKDKDHTFIRKKMRKTPILKKAVQVDIIANGLYFIIKSRNTLFRFFHYSSINTSYHPGLGAINTTIPGFLCVD